MAKIIIFALLVLAVVQVSLLFSSFHERIAGKKIGVKHLFFWCTFNRRAWLNHAHQPIPTCKLWLFAKMPLPRLFKQPLLDHHRWLRHCKRCCKMWPNSQIYSHEQARDKPNPNRQRPTQSNL